MSIARNIINEHGGEITIDSELGAGTTVFIRMPKHPKMTNNQDNEPIALDSITSIASLVEKAIALNGNSPSLN
ncbi:sensory histidine kinase AtoS [bacterium BMS3Bbin04]|nr:sensory histidine kinase AtoS [bacterium BMS3Bbin04]